MKLKKLLPHLAVLLAGALVLSGCANSVDSMMDDYNGQFCVESEKYVDNYTVDNVVAEQMLRPYYAVNYLSTLCLLAPSGAAGYTWKVVVQENAAGEASGTTYLLGHSRLLDVYLLKSSIKRWGSYKLILTVKKYDGEYLEDTAMLYVY